MKKRSFISGIITAFIIVNMISAVTAKTGTVDQSVIYNNIGVILDGKRLDLVDSSGNSVEPFMYNNTNYLPVRAVAEALGLDVSFDGSQNSIVLTTKNQGQVTPPPIDPTAGGTTYDRLSPAPIGTAQQVTVKEYWGSYTATVKVDTVYRGALAWTQIKNANRFNKEAPAGKEYILAKITVTVDQISTDRAVDVDKYDFTAFSSGNAEYDRVATVNPSPLSGSAYEGATVSGWVSFVVDKDDSAPKIVYGADLYGTGGIWFSISGN